MKILSVVLYLVSFTALCCMGVPTILNRQLYQENSPFPPVSLLLHAFIATIVLASTRYILVNYVFVHLGPMVLKNPSKDKVDRFATVVFKFLYFLVVTVWGYRILHHQIWWPKILGGQGDILNIFRGYPHHLLEADVSHYYVVQFGYHAHSLVYHLLSPHRNDFAEMLVHHISAICLVMFSFMNNYFRIGTIVYFLHDIVDIFGYLTKSVVDTRFTPVTLSSYVMLLFNWALFRLYVLPAYILHTVVTDFSDQSAPQFHDKVSYVTMAILLFVLQGLHIYWFYLFLVMGYNFLVTGVTEDIQQKVGKSELEERRKSDSTKPKVQ